MLGVSGHDDFRLVFSTRVRPACAAGDARSSSNSHTQLQRARLHADSEAAMATAYVQEVHTYRVAGGIYICYVAARCDVSCTELEGPRKPASHDSSECNSVQ